MCTEDLCTYTYGTTWSSIKYNLFKDKSELLSSTFKPTWPINPNSDQNNGKDMTNEQNSAADEGHAKSARVKSS